MKLKYWPEKYVIFKIKLEAKNQVVSKLAELLPDQFFSLTQTHKEVSLVLSENQVKFISAKDIIAQEKGWRVITFDSKLDFSIVGFLAKVSTALAQSKISIFAISTYDTDHILVKEKDFKKAQKVLNKILSSLV